MLSPKGDTAIDLLTDIYTNFLGMSNYDATCNSLFIGHVAKDPAWLVEVRRRGEVLRGVMQQKPKIFAQIITSFNNYQTTFDAIAQNSKVLTSTNQWIECLQLLQKKLKQNIAVTNEGQQVFTKSYSQAKYAEELLASSIQDGWNELASEEHAMVRIATGTGSLSQSIASLGTTITAAELRAGKAYIQSMVTISYGVVKGTIMTGPFLSFAGALFTVGYSAYSTISSAKEVQQNLDKLTQLQTLASEEAQASAITKAIIQTLSNMSEEFLKLDDSLSTLSLLWQDESDKVSELINALQSGSEPARLTDLQTIKIASASWKTISEFVQLISLPPNIGKPVLVNTQNNTIQEQ
ncbi:hypothetical protein J3N71_004727 [Salmonella enterica subsp. enterica serovar Oranienburg]|nr:hypothetical protein [Salmonella enterica subsp. enterica serovar Oranienburg]